MTEPASDIQAPARRSKIRAVVFACRWCALVGADRAGKERMDLPASFRVIPVECAAGVEPDLVLRAFADGVDGVAVMGCHLGGCRHNEANRPARLRLMLLQDLLDIIGLDRSRLLLSWGTAHEGYQFAGLMREFTAILAGLPPVDSRLLGPC